MKTAYEITFKFESSEQLSIPLMLRKLQELTENARLLSPNLTDWLLGGKTKEEAYLYKVFEDGQPTTAVQAVLGTRYKNSDRPKIVALWNGLENGLGARIDYIQVQMPANSLVTLSASSESFSTDWKVIAKLIETGVELWNPKAVSVESNGYYGKEVFPDRYRVSWMLYLPKVITAQQVPEARETLNKSTKIILLRY
jgi:hypothetical protein